MKQQICPVRACGARIILVEIDGKPVALNPIQFEVVVEEGGSLFRRVKGFQPHAYTCLDLDARSMIAGDR